MLGVGGGEDIEGGRIESGGGRAASVSHYRRQLGDQSGEAVREGAVIEGVLRRLELRPFGALCWCHWIARGFGLLIDVGETYDFEFTPDRAGDYTLSTPVAAKGVTWTRHIRVREK